jgi:hypothetical protein
MSLAITGYALAVLSAAVLTFGTVAQALSSFAEFKSLNQAVNAEIEEERKKGKALPHPPIWTDGRVSIIPLIWFNLALLFRVTKAAGRIRAGGGEQGAQLARFLRLAEVWGVLAIGSVLALAAAVIQLRLGVISGRHT